LTLEQADIGYGEIKVIHQANLSISPGDRIGLLGANGAGKSSLIKVLAGDLLPLAGKKLDADALKIGYFAQHQLEQLRLDESPLWHLQQLDKQATEKDLRNFLGGFDFQGDKVLQAVKPFSGGEKARLVLAMLVYQNPNLLLLDEPTNHLDLEMRHALGVALQDYEGAMVVVSHDRHLLRSVTDRFLLVAEGKAIPFEGDLEDYRLFLADKKKSAEKNDTDNNLGVSRKDQRKLDAEWRKKHKPLFDAVKKAESIVEKYHLEQRLLEHQLADSAIYADTERARLKELLERKAQVDKALENAEAQWLEAEERIEDVK
jgi:ATP-binding cassette subfamily F protein 3